jgi:hypothetical protein
MVVRNSRTDVMVKLDYHSASVLAVLQRFSVDADINGFKGEKVHLLVNVITLDHSIRDPFDRLWVYFEATVSLNLYSPDHDAY